MAYSPDGKILASADGTPGHDFRGLGFSDRHEGGIRLWDATTGTQLRRLAGHEGVIRFLAFLADGKRLISAGDDCRARLWDLATGQETASFEVPGGLIMVGLSPDGKTLAAGTQGGVRLFDVATGNEIKRLELAKAHAYEPGFSPDGKILVAGFGISNGGGYGVCAWDVATGNELYKLPGEGANPESFSPDGKVLATRASDDLVRLRDVATGKELRTLGGRKGDGRCIRFSQDGKVLFGIDRALRYEGAILMDVATGNELRRFGREEGLSYYAGALAPDGKALALSDSRAVRVFDVTTGKQLLPTAGHTGEVETVAFSPDGKKALTGGYRQLFLWDAATGKELAAIGPTSEVGAAAFAPDGKSVVAGYHDEEAIRVWEVATGKESRRFEGEPGAVVFLGFLTDGKSVVSMAEYRTTSGPGGSVRHNEQSLRIWDVTTGKEVRQIQDENMLVGRAAASADGRVLAGARSGNVGQIQVWDAVSGRERAKLDMRHGFYALALTPDGRRLLYSAFDAADKRPVHIWEAATATEMGRIAVPGGVALALAVSPDGRVVAAGCSDGTVRLWDIVTGKELRKLVGHQGPVLCLAFSPDGRRLLSGSRDTTALIWDVADVLPAEPPARLDAAELKDLWVTLASPDGAAALKAVRRLARDPERSLAHVREQLGKQPAADPERLAQLVADLDADDFNKREAATAELGRLGKLAEDALKQALADKPSAEMRVRAGSLLKRLEDYRVAPAELQALRAVEVLELIATPQARKVIDSLATSSPSARISEEAKAALDRLARRQAEAPGR